MLELIILVVVIVIIINNQKKKKDGGFKGGGTPVKTIVSEQPRQGGQVSGRMGMPLAQADGQRNYQRNYDNAGNPRHNTGMGAPGGGTKNVPQEQRKVQNPGMQQSVGQTEQEIVRREGESTTDYLNRKAAMDEREHRAEQLEQKRAERQNYGDIVYAGRWMEGDPVPQSRRLVECGYCGAENLVPLHDKKRYHCYFCREKLQG